MTTATAPAPPRPRSRISRCTRDSSDPPPTPAPAPTPVPVSPLDISLTTVARHPEHHTCPPAAVWHEADDTIVVCGCGVVLDRTGPVAHPSDVQTVIDAIDRVQAPHGTPHDLAPHGAHRKLGAGRAEHCGACRTSDPTTLARALAVVIAQARAEAYQAGWQHAVDELADAATPERIGA